MKLKNKFKFKIKLTDILLIILVILVLIPQTRQPLLVFVKRISNLPPFISSNDHYGRLSEGDYQWKFVDVDGRTYHLTDFNEKPIFINFWATWCPPCIAEMPSIYKLYNDYSDQVNFLFFSNEDHSITQAFLEKNEWCFNTYKPLFASPDLLDSNTLPTTFIIDKDGNIIVKEKGNKKWDSNKVRNLLDELLIQN
jgi:thiol-disulfide isomerase/thioredoxin